MVSETKETPFKHAISLTVSEQNGQENAVKKHYVSGLVAETVGLTAAFLSAWHRYGRVESVMTQVTHHSVRCTVCCRDRLM